MHPFPVDVRSRVGEACWMLLLSAEVSLVTGITKYWPWLQVWHRTGIRLEPLIVCAFCVNIWNYNLPSLILECKMGFPYPGENLKNMSFCFLSVLLGINISIRETNNIGFKKLAFCFQLSL
jgi:hypothetical protein